MSRRVTDFAGSSHMLHELLTRSRDAIVVRCEQKLRRLHPDRLGDELLFTIPRFLDELIDLEARRREAGLSEDTPLPLPEIAQSARAHAVHRFRHGHHPAALPLDFATIVDAIGELATEQDVSLDPRSTRLLDELIDKASRQAITEYFTLSREAGEITEWIGSLDHELRTGMERRRRPVLLSAVVDGVVACASREHGITIESDIPADLEVMAAPHLLESALSNLVHNAVKHTRDGGRVTIRASSDDSCTTIDVYDECGGLVDGSLGELIGGFVRVRAGKGARLGLAIARQAIDAHGGRVTLHDRAPIGCVVTVVLPR